MPSKSEIMPLIYSAIDAVNLGLTKEGQLEKSPSTRLLDKDAKLDSLGFIDFTAALEELIYERWGIPLTLVTEKTMMSDEAPLQTVDKLAEYIAGLNLRFK
jgi:hypothetical protein